MISDKQLMANQENALLGGVKTTEGKEVSKFNALTHGILRQSITDYESEFYVDTYDTLINQYHPSTLIERILIERITIYYLKLFRVQKAETEFMKAKLNPCIVQTRDFTEEIMNKMLEKKVINEGYTPLLTGEAIQKIMEIYSRYEGMIENRLYRALHELEWLQKSNKTQEMGSFGKNSHID